MLVFSVLLPALLRAQSSTEPPPTNLKVDEKIVKLSPFQVDASRDVGYRAFNTITGLRLNMALMDIPINVVVLDKEFLKDTMSLYTTDSILRYVAGIGAGDQDIGSLVLRSNNTQFSLRDGFRVATATPSIFTERVEVVAGSVGVIYGVSSPSGVLNTVTKRALPGSDQFEFSGWVDNNNGYSGSADINLGTMAGGKLAVRLMGEDRQGGYLPFFGAGVVGATSQSHYTNLRGKIWSRPVAGAVTYRLSTSSEVRILYSNLRQNRPGGAPYYFLRDGSTTDAVPGQIMNPSIPWTFTASRGNDSRHERNISGWFEQQVTPKLNIMVGVMSQDLERINASGGVGNINANIPATVTKPAVRVGFTRTDTLTKGFDALLVGTYKFDVKPGPLGKIGNTLILNLQRSKSDITVFQRIARNAAGSPLFAYVPVAEIDQEAEFTKQGIDQNPDNWTLTPGDNFNNRWFNSVVAAYHGSFFNDRLLLTLAGLHLIFEQDTYQTQGFPTPRTPDKASVVRYDTHKNQPLVGATYKVFRGLHAYASYSESVFPDPRLDGFNRSLPPPIGQGGEAGIKFDLWGGKVTGAMCVYNTEIVNQITSDPNAPNINTPITGQTGAFVSRGPTILRGFESQFLFSPLPNWQTIFSYAYMDPYVKENKVNPNEEGDPIDSALPNSWALWSKYRVPKGPAKNLSLAFGISWASGLYDRTFNLPGGSKLHRYYPSRIKDTEVNIGYGRTYGRYHVNWILNVHNVLYRGVDTGWVPTADGSPSTQSYKVPSYGRDYTLSMSVKF